MSHSCLTNVDQYTPIYFKFIHKVPSFNSNDRSHFFFFSQRHYLIINVIIIKKNKEDKEGEGGRKYRRIIINLKVYCSHGRIDDYDFQRNYTC